MRIRACVIAVLFVAVSGSGLDRASGAGVSNLTGVTSVETMPSCNAYQTDCVIEHLAAIDYTSVGSQANITTLGFALPQGQTLCLGYGPGACEHVGTTEAFVVNEANTVLNVHGLCSKVLGRTATCQSRTAYDTFATALLPVAVNIDLGGGNDFFSAVLDGLQGWPSAFTVTTGGGPDHITLLDATSPATGPDRISCGAGIDTVVTMAATTVETDCEDVTRI